MRISKKQMKCVHTFLATNRKSVLKVESTSKNLRGKPTKVDVVATIFKCSKCGVQKKYPDFWEKSFNMLPSE
jgi:hypothetical protein